MESIKRVNDIKKIRKEDWNILAQEIRDFLIRRISMTGGHLGSNLGAVELTMALHLALDLPEDKIIWDVGHQSYTHKILTGRGDRFDTLRQFHGLSGFPKRKESECDVFDTGHSSTSISAGLGLVRARDITGGKNIVVSVIGDGSLTGGMAYEALNNAAKLETNFIIVLNDNNMSISENVGGVSKYLNNIRTATSYLDLKEGIYNVLAGTKRGNSTINKIRKAKSSFKHLVIPGMLFEDMGLTYLGPVDGHDIPGLITVINEARRVKGPVLIHALTQKGKGYLPAERHPARFHGAEPFEISTGIPSNPRMEANYTDIFSTVMCKLGQRDQRIVAITAAMPDGTGTSMFQSRFPSRFIDVGICEEHAVTLAAGLAARGMRPVVAIYSTFLQRAYDQIIHDVCLQNLPVTFCLDRAGLVGEDGPTHHGAFDLSWLRAVPGLSLLAPRDELDLRNCLATALTLDAPAALRYPRGRSERLPMDIREKCQKGDPPDFTLLPVGEGELTLRGKELCVMAVGLQVHMAEEAARRIEAESGRRVSVFDARWVKPLPEKQILELARAHRALLLVEENTRAGGFSSAVLELLADNDLLLDKTVRRAALPDAFVPHGSCEQLRALTGLDQDHLYALITAMLDA